MAYDGLPRRFEVTGREMPTCTVMPTNMCIASNASGVLKIAGAREFCDSGAITYFEGRCRTGAGDSDISMIYFMSTCPITYACCPLSIFVSFLEVSVSMRLS
jgi:hypothetical protein